MAVLRAQLHVSPRGRLEHPELALAPGPAAEGDTGDGSLSALYGYAWALVWDRTRPELVLCRVVDGDLVEVTPSAPLPALTRPARHISLAFDGSARPMIAWQGRQGIYVRQWDLDTAAYVVRGPFPGHDPVLIADAVPRGMVSGSDVVLGHLSPDRSELVARLERNVYAVPYTLAELPPAPSGRPWYLDQVTPLTWRMQWVLVTDELTAETRGLPAADQRLERIVYRTELYPLPTAHDAAGVTAAAAGTMQATTYPVADADAAGVTAAAAGTMQATTYPVGLADTAGVTASPSGRMQATTATSSGADVAGVTAGASGVLRATTKAMETENGASVTAAVRGVMRHVA